MCFARSCNVVFVFSPSSSPFRLLSVAIAVAASQLTCRSLVLRPILSVYTHRIIFLYDSSDAHVDTIAPDEEHSVQLAHTLLSDIVFTHVYVHTCMHTHVTCSLLCADICRGIIWSLLSVR